MSEFIPVNEPLFIGNEKIYLNKCIDTGWISSAGEFVENFESSMAKRCHREHAISVSSGTSALEIAIRALGIKKGDEVIIPSLTIISCSNSIIKAGATPVLVDSNESTFNMEAQEIEKKITSKTKAIMLVHLYGLPVDLDPILEIAKKHNLKIIEDAAEMAGQKYKNKPCGSFGDVSIFSFYANKHITTGEGGMILTNSLDIESKCRSLRDHCFMPGRRFLHDDIGSNARMTNIQAAIGLAQLETLDKFIIKKRAMGSFYYEQLKGLNCIELPIQETEYAKNIYWVFTIVLKESSLHDSESMMKELSKNGIGSRPFFWPIHQQPIYKEMGLFKNETYPIAEKLSKSGLYIPSGLKLDQEQMLRVTDSIKKILKKS